MIEKKEIQVKHETKCSFCNTEYFYTDSDIVDIDASHYGFICPECGNEIITGNIEHCVFPDSFFRYGNGAVLTNEETQKYIDIVKKNLMEDENNYSYSFAGTGDTMVFGTKEEGIYYDINVAKNYWHDSWSVED